MKIHLALWGAGNIAKKVAEAVKSDADFVLTGVASRNADHAEDTARELKIKAYNSYDDLLNDADVDFVYISTPTVCHFNDMKRVILAGKNIICEKPFTESCYEAEEILELAEKENIVIIDGLWSMYMPLVEYISEEASKMGKLLFASASLGYPTIRNDSGTIKSKYEIWDYEIYPVSIMTKLFGLPRKIKSKRKQKNGLVLKNVSYLKFAKGGAARVHSSLCHRTSYCFFAFFSKGVIISRKWWFGNRKVYIFKLFKKPIVKSFVHKINGYEYEVEEAKNRYLHEEVRCMSCSDSLKIMRAMDMIKDSISD